MVIAIRTLEKRSRNIDLLTFCYYRQNANHASQVCCVHRFSGLMVGHSNRDEIICIRVSWIIRVLGHVAVKGLSIWWLFPDLGMYDK